MRKPTKKGMKRKLDQIVSKIKRSLGYCEKCGPHAFHDYSQLQCAHIYSRSKLSVRWDLDNLLCLCADCHMNFAHKNPLEFAEFVKGHLGPIKYQSLKFKANAPQKWALEEMVEQYGILSKMFEECYEGNQG